MPFWIVIWLARKNSYQIQFRDDHYPLTPMACRKNSFEGFISSFIFGKPPIIAVTQFVIGSVGSGRYVDPFFRQNLLSMPLTTI